MSYHLSRMSWFHVDETGSLWILDIWTFANHALLRELTKN